MQNLITFNLITRDNADSIVEALNSTLPANITDYVICDTGSQDNTIDLIAGWGHRNKKNIKIVEYKDVYGYSFDSNDYSTYNFGKARQLALNEVKTPYMVWMDSDDVLEGSENLNMIAQRYLETDVTQIMFLYRYATDQSGNDAVVHWRERLIKITPKMKWREPVHEYIFEGYVPTISFEQGIIWTHKRKPEHINRTKRRNRDILRHQYNSLLKQGKKLHLRMLQNMAFDHFERKEFTEAVEFYEQFFTRHAELADSSPEKQLHKSQILHNLLNWARCEIELENYDSAEQILERTRKLDEFNRDYYISLAEIRARQGLPQQASSYLTLAEQTPVSESIMPNNQVEMQIRPVLLWLHIFKATGQLEMALKKVQQSLRIMPYNDLLKREAKNLQRNIEQKASFDGFYALRNELLNTGDWEGLGSLIDAIPDTIGQQASIVNDVKDTTQRVKRNLRRISKKMPKEKTIAFYTGPAYEKWDGNSRGKGIGGSEEMVIGLALELHRLGNKVTVFCDTNEGNYDGVEYVDFKKYKPETKYDVLIVSRIPQMFAQPVENGIQINDHAATRQILWLHDTHYGNLPTASFGLADEIWVLSEWQKEYIKEMYNLPDDKFWVTRNGIDIDHYKTLKTPERNLKQVIYCSSYDRGLYEALMSWKEIKKAVPDAVFKVYYGWDTYVKRMELMPANYSDHPSGLSMRQYKAECDRLMQETGVQDGGRIGQDELYLEMARSNVWFYPTWFSEISCITAMRAQYAGAIPVTSPVAALPETVKEGFVLPDKHTEKVIELLNTPDESLRSKVIKAGESYSISTLAKEWDDRLSN